MAFDAIMMGAVAHEISSLGVLKVEKVLRRTLMIFLRRNLKQLENILQMILQVEKAKSLTKKRSKIF